MKLDNTSPAFSKTEKYILFATGLVLFIFIFARAALVPLVGDEVGTFYLYIQTHNFLPYQAHWDANNHLLNSALSVAFTQLFGNAEWVLRLANVIFFPLYLFYAYKLAGLLNNKVLQWAVILSLWFAHNFIEFFGYCRGYGISMALLLGALYYTACFINTPKTRLALWALVFNMVMVFANLSLLNTFLLINATVLFVAFLNYNTIHKLRLALGFLFLTVLPGAFFVVYSFELKKRNLLYYGSTDSFIKVTLNTLSDLVVSTKHPVVIYSLIAAFFVLLVVCGINKIKALKYLNTTDYFVGLLLGNIVIIFLLAILLKVNYPEDRVGMYLFPLFILAIAFVANSLKGYTKYAMVLPALFFPIHFAAVANVTYSKQWYEDHIPRRYFDAVQAAPMQNGYPSTVSAYKMRTLTWAYFNMRRNACQNQIQETNFRDNFLADFIISRKQDVTGWEQYYKQVDFDEVSKLALLKRRQALQFTKIVEAKVPDKLNNKDEFIGFFELKHDSIAGKAYKVEVQCTVQTLEEPLPQGRVVLVVSDKKGNTLGYYYQDLEWLFGYQPNNTYPVKLSFIIPGYAQAHQLIMYYWSIKQNKVNFTSGSYSIYSVK
jgi:hypothetical protein